MLTSLAVLLVLCLSSYQCVCSCNQLEWVPTSPDAGPRVQTGDVWGRAPEPASHSPSPPAYREHDNGVLSSWAAQDMLGNTSDMRISR